MMQGSVKLQKQFLSRLQQPLERIWFLPRTLLRFKTAQTVAPILTMRLYTLRIQR